MALLIIKKLKAFTIVESLVSLMLISFAVGASLILFNYSNVRDYDRQEAKFLADEYLMKLEEGEVNIDRPYYRANNLSISPQFQIYREIQGVYLVSVQVMKKDKVLYRTQKLLLLNED